MNDDETIVWLIAGWCCTGGLALFLGIGMGEGWTSESASGGTWMFGVFTLIYIVAWALRLAWLKGRNSR